MVNFPASDSFVWKFVYAPLIAVMFPLVLWFFIMTSTGQSIAIAALIGVVIMSRQPSFIDRYRWWLFLGSFGIQILSRLVIDFNLLVALGISVVAAIAFLLGIAGFISHAQRRRKERDAAKEQS